MSWNLQQKGKVIRPFCWHQNFVPWGLSTPAPGLYTCIKSWKDCFKSDFKDIFFETCNKWMKWQDISVEIKLCPLGAVYPCPGAIYMYKIMKKKCITSDLKEIFLKLATNDRSDKMFLLTSKFHPQAVVSPCPGAIYMYQIMKKKKCIKSDLKEILLKLVANDRSDKWFLLTWKFCPLGLSAPDMLLYTFINTWKDVYKVRGWWDSF